MFDKNTQLQKNCRLRDGVVEKSERLRDPVPKSTVRLRDPVPKKTERLRDPVSKKTERLREPVPKKTERIKSPTRIKTERLKALPLKDKNYLQWFHAQGYGCLVCGLNPIEAHHVQRGSFGRPDDTIVPLCPEHHRGRHSPHGFDSDRFAVDYPKDVLLEIAQKLYDAYLIEKN